MTRDINPRGKKRGEVSPGTPKGKNPPPQFKKGSSPPQILESPKFLPLGVKGIHPNLATRVLKYARSRTTKKKKGVNPEGEGTPTPKN